MFIKRLEAIEKMLDEGWLEFGGKIRIVGIDPSRIAVFEFVMGADHLKINQDDDIQMAINIFDFCKVLRRLKNSEILRLIYDQESYQITIVGRVNNRKKTFKLPEIDISDQEEFPFEKLLAMSLPAMFWIEANDFKDMVEDCEMYSDAVDIGTGNDKVLVKAFYPNAEVSSEIEMPDIIEGVVSSYSIRFLKILINCMLGSKLLVRFGAGKPMIVLDKIDEETRMLWFLAPRIVEADFEDDDDDF